MRTAEPRGEFISPLGFLLFGNERGFAAREGFPHPHVETYERIRVFVGMDPVRGGYRCIGVY